MQRLANPLSSMSQNTVPAQGEVDQDQILSRAAMLDKSVYQLVRDHLKKRDPTQRSASGAICDNQACENDHHERSTIGAMRSDHNERSAIDAMRSDHDERSAIDAMRSDHDERSTSGAMRNDHDERSTKSRNRRKSKPRKYAVPSGLGIALRRKLAVHALKRWSGPPVRAIAKAKLTARSEVGVSRSRSLIDRTRPDVATAQLVRAPDVHTQPLTQPRPKDAYFAWKVGAVCVGDGSVSTNGRNRLETGKFYNSEQLRGSYEQFHAETHSWDSLESVGFERIELSTYWVCSQKRKSIPAPSFMLPASRADERRPKRSLIKRREYAAQELFEFCFSHPGLAVIVAGILSRKPSTALAAQLDTTEPPVLGSELSCYIAALLNGMRCVLDDKLFNECEPLVREQSPQGLSLKQLETHLRSMRLNIMASKSRSGELRSLAPQNRFDWLASITSGVWIVHIKFKNKLDHVICVDAARKLIYDNVETHPFPMNAKNLRLCGGDEHPQCYIEAIRELSVRNIKH